MIIIIMRILWVWSLIALAAPYGFACSQACPVENISKLMAYPPPYPSGGSGYPGQTTQYPPQPQSTSVSLIINNSYYY